VRSFVIVISGCHNISVYSELWEEVKNESRYQKEGKNEESNRICGKNKKGAKGSRSSIEESIREDETTDR